MPSGSGRQFAGAHFEDKSQFAGVDFKSGIDTQIAMHLVALKFFTTKYVCGTYNWHTKESK